MSVLDTTMRPSVGFDGPVLRADWQLVKPVDTNTTALALRGGLVPDDFTTAILGEGMVAMGPNDAVQIEVLGTADGGTANVLVTAWNPVVKAGVIYGWLEDHVATLVFTMGTKACTGEVAGGSLHPDIAETDLWADTVTMSLPAGPPSAATDPPPGYILHSPADNTKAFAIVPGDQHRYLQIRSERGTAARSGVIARKLQGAAQRS